MEGYKILTPKFRDEINQGFDSTIEDLMWREYGRSI